MKFLCLAYGSESDWKELSKQEQQSLLAQDDVLRKRGDFIAAVETSVTTVKNRDGRLNTKDKPFAKSDAPLAGFYIIEATNLDEAVDLIANTPCARANGAIEIRPLSPASTNTSVNIQY